MGFKKKVLGTLAAAALTLSMFGGVAAQTASDSVSGSVNLDKGICKVNITEGSVNFGTWTYQGDGYARTAGNNAVSLNVKVTAGEPGGLCDATISTGGLNGPGGLIGANHFTAGLNGGAQQNLAGHDIADGSMTVNDLPAVEGSVDLTLVSVPNTYQTGTYSGTLNVSVINAN